MGGWVISNVVGVICPLDWNKVSVSTQLQGQHGRQDAKTKVLAGFYELERGCGSYGTVGMWPPLHMCTVEVLPAKNLPWWPCQMWPLCPQFRRP